MKAPADYTIRTMIRSEVDIAIEWAAAEGWNPGLDDAECFYRADPEGFLIGSIGNKPVASISVVSYGESFAFLGLYIVCQEYRGKGLGLRIWNAGLEKLEGRTIGLDGVVAQQDNYRKSGFNLAYRNIRFQGTGGEASAGHERILKLSEIPFDEIHSYDNTFFPEERQAFLKCWINRKNSTALGIINHNRLAGYGVIRSCRSGYKIGPLFADSADLAETLFCALKSSVPEGSTVFLDIPEVNPAALDLVRRYSMTVVFETARMYKGRIPELPLNRIFGVTSFELG